MALNVVCRIHPVVLFTIVDSYERRTEDTKRVIGALLGTADNKAIEVSNCFTVPHNESEDEVAIDIEYVRNMYELHKKVSSQETIVGWYTTGSEVTAHSVLIHEYFGRECKSPVHVTVDTTMKSGHFGLKAYTSAIMGVPKKTTGTMFQPMTVEFMAYDPERVGVDMIQLGKFNPKRTVSLSSDLVQITQACLQLQEMLKTVTQYVEDVIAGKIAPDVTVGRGLMQLLDDVPKIDPEAMEEMLNSNMKDLLMVVYLSDLIKTQVMLNEKLSTIV